jgi:poly(3-hydroxybutyrate) depolymerase
MAATAELFERTTRRYGKPSFDLPTTKVGFDTVAVSEKIVWQRPFCNLIRFERDLPASRRPDASFSSSRRCPAIMRRCCAAPSMR